MLNRSRKSRDTTDYEDKEEESAPPGESTPAERLENSQIISLMIGLMGLGFIIYHFVQNGFDLNLNIDKHDSAILGAAAACDCRIKCPRYYGLSPSDIVLQFHTDFDWAIILLSAETSQL